MPAATFTNLFDTDLLLHYDVSDSSRLFTDTGGTVAAVDGNEVKCFKPSSDAANAVNLTNANGPIYRSNYSATGYPALQFDGVNDALSNAAAGLPVGTRFYTLTALSPIAGVGTVWSRGASGSFFSRVYVNTAPGYLAQAVGSGSFSIGITLASGKIVIATVYGDGHNQIDGLGQSTGTQATGTVSASMTDKFSIGAWDAGGGLTQFGNFALHEILIIGSNCEWGQVLRAAKILRNKWGIADPNALPQSSAAATKPQHPMTQQVIG